MEDPARVYTISNVQTANRMSGNNQASSEHKNGLLSRFNFVNIKSKGSVFMRNDFYKRLSIILCLLLLFVFIGFIILICKYKKEPTDLCESDECLRSAANLRLSIDFAADPCNDFYQFTCGRWIDEHPNHGWYPTFSSFRLIDERVSLATLKFLKSNASEDEPMAVQGTRALYKSCLNDAATNELGYTVIHKYLEKVGLPLVPQALKDGELETFDWVNMAAKIKKTFAMDLVFNFAIDADIYNRSRFVMYLSSNLGDSPLPSPFKRKQVKNKFLVAATDDDPKEPEPEDTNEDIEEDEPDSGVPTGTKLAMEKIISEVIKNSSESLEISEEKMSNAIEVIFNLTIDISNIAGENDTDLDDIDLIKYKVSELQASTDKLAQSKEVSPVDIWKPYLEELFKDLPSSFDFDNDMIYFLKSEYGEVLELAVHMSAMTAVDLEMYFWYKVVESMIAGTTSEINEYIYRQTSFEFLAYPEVARSRALECAQLVSSYMGMAVTYGIADRNFENTTLPEVKQMLDDIKTAFVSNVGKMNWMDSKTKVAAITKSKEMIGLIGFPDWLYNKTAVDVYYADITLKPDTFLENLLGIVQTYVPDMLKIFNEENEKQWRTDPNVVNAFHYVADNSINVPMAILTFPIYHLGLEVLNYGAIGSILGHELTHGFDTLGKHYNKEGNMVDWWTNITSKTFDEKTQCFINQYNSYVYEKLNVTVNGRLTLSENIADNGGVNQAFNAYQLFVTRNGPEQRLPGFEEYTNDQMFFIAYGSIWCEAANIHTLRDQLEHDEHSPSYSRVIGSLQNSEDFAKAFRCRKGSNMNPKEKCKIW